MNAILRILIWGFAVFGIVLVAGEEADIGALSFFEFVAWKMLGMALCVSSYLLWKFEHSQLLVQLRGDAQRRKLLRRGLRTGYFINHLARKNRRAPAENGGAHA